MALALVSVVVESVVEEGGGGSGDLERCRRQSPLRERERERPLRTREVMALKKDCSVGEDGEEGARRAFSAEAPVRVEESEKVREGAFGWKVVSVCRVIFGAVCEVGVSGVRRTRVFVQDDLLSFPAIGSSRWGFSSSERSVGWLLSLVLCSLRWRLKVTTGEQLERCLISV